MRRTGTGAWGLLLACATSAGAQVDGLELSAPSDLPPPAAASADPLPVADLPEPKPAPADRPMLIRPRLRTGPTMALPMTTQASPSDDLPPLTGPDEMARPTARPGGTGPTARAPKPLILESVPRDAVEFGPAPSTPAPGRAISPDDPLPDAGFGSLPGRRPRMIDRFPAATGTPRSPDRSKASALDKEGIEPKSDPAADAALKRRVERDVREAVGDRLRSLEVLVVNRRVVVQASATRFWLRRALRRSIETLPVLSGTRATVHVDD